MKVIALLSEKGGIGRSVLSVALAAAMVRQNKRVVVADLDPRIHTLDLYTGMQDRALFGLDDFFFERAELSKILLKDERLEGFWLSPAPADVQCLTVPNAQVFRDALEKELSTDYLLLDLPSRSEEAFSFAEKIADVFLVLSDAHDVSLLAAQIMAERIRGKEGYLLLNRIDLYALFQKGERKKVSEMIDIVHLPLIAIIPESEELYRAVNKGLLQYMTGEAVVPFDNLAYRLAGGQRLLFDGMKDGKKIRRNL